MSILPSRALPVKPAPWFVAVSPRGELIESCADCERLLGVLLTEVMDRGGEDVLIVSEGRVLFVIKGDSLSVVPVR